MALLQKLSLKMKLYILSIFILASLIIIAMIGYRNITEMKRSLDALYFGSFIPINNLNTIVTLYNDEIKERFLEAQNGTIKPEVAAHEMAKNLTKIRALWNSYAKSYKQEKELPYINYTTARIEESEAYFIKIIESCYQGCKSNTTSYSAMLKQIQQVQDALRNLIRYESDSAQFERHQLLNTYDSTLFRIAFVLALVVLSVMAFSFLIFKSINRTQNHMQRMTEELKLSNKKLEEASFTDSLTQLYNRRYFNMIFDRELKRAKRTKTTLAFYMLDIDFFKQYNDTYGHLEGDRTLQAVAKSLKALFQRPGDFVFRLGGEEFGILVIDAQADMAEFMAMKTIKAIHELEIPHASSDADDYVSVSLGFVVTQPTLQTDEDHILSEADKSLYKAKEGGRNRYVIGSL